MVARKLFDIKVSNCNGDYIIKLSNILVETEVLLTQHNQMEWLTSKPAVKLMEDKEKEEWAVQMDSYEGTKYERLKQFLHARRMVAERLKAIGTQKRTTKKNCVEACIKDCCLRKGHKSAKKDRRGGSDERLCDSCGEPGHLSWACPTPGEGKGSKGRGGAGATQGRVGTRGKGRGSEGSTPVGLRTRPTLAADQRTLS